ncbi:hypothetical protein CF327_g7350 [Tilletia walkeri]|nr:hypothetical protein CF327_g7350 [Tilletia walkeri]
MATRHCAHSSAQHAVAAALSHQPCILTSSTTQTLTSSSKRRLISTHPPTRTASRCTPPPRRPALVKSRSISFFLAQPPLPSQHEDQYAQQFLRVMLGRNSSGTSSSNSTHSPLALIQSESDVLAMFRSINIQLGYSPETHPPQRAWNIAFRTLLEEEHVITPPDSSSATPNFIELMRSEVEDSKRKHAFDYDLGRIYEARSLYKTYLRRLHLAQRHAQQGLDLEGDELEAAQVLPLLRAYTHSFVPDIPRAFGLYEDLLTWGSFGKESSTAHEEREVYALLIGLCVRNNLFARAIRLVRDMTLLGIAQLFHNGSLAASLTVDSGLPPASDLSTTVKAPLFLSRRDRVDLLNILMRSATSYAEAYAIYWRLHRMWAGVQAEALARRLRDRNHLERDRGGLISWARRIASRAHPYEYLGEGVDDEGTVDRSWEALAFWRLDSAADPSEDWAARDSVLLTEDELLAEDVHIDNFQSSRFSLGSILGRLQTQTRSSKEEAILTIYASPEERRARLNASPFPAHGWRHILSAFPNLPCGWVEVHHHPTPSAASSTRNFGRPPRREKAAAPVAKVEQVWIPAPPELVISIFWDMLQSGASPPPPVYTNLLHYYTRLVKASRQKIWASSERDASDDGGSQSKELEYIQDHQRRLIASEAISSLHKLIHLDINLEPDLPLINALMNAYGHLGQIHDVFQIWQSLVNLSGGSKMSLSDQGEEKKGGQGQRGVGGKVTNRMDARSVAIVLDACGFAPSLPFSRARSVVAWARHRDRLAMSLALDDTSSPSIASSGSASGSIPPTSPPPPSPDFLMSKGAWDAWLECLCRRGHVREAFEVFTREMVPILDEQRRSFAPREEASGVLGPDQKTLEMLLGFAARDLHKVGAAGSDSARRVGSSSSGVRAEVGASVGVGLGVGGSAFASPAPGGGVHSGDSSLEGSARRRDASVWKELRGWIQREMPGLWESVRDIGTTPGRTSRTQRNGKT